MLVKMNEEVEELKRQLKQWKIEAMWVKTKLHKIQEQVDKSVNAKDKVDDFNFILEIQEILKS